MDFMYLPREYIFVWLPLKVDHMILVDTWKYRKKMIVEKVKRL